MENFNVDLQTESEFFVGNLNKTKTRDEIFKELTAQITIDSLGGEHLYIKKFNMPKFNARKDKDGTLLLNLGYAFITTSKREMAQELIKRGRMKLEDGTDIEFKPIEKCKRLKANENCKQKNFNKFNGKEDDKFSNWRNHKENDKFSDWRNHNNRKLESYCIDNSWRNVVEPQYLSKSYFENQKDSNNNNQGSIFDIKNNNMNTSSSSLFDHLG